MLEALRAANPKVVIKELVDPSFGAYGRILEDPSLAGLADRADRLTGIDREANRYVGSMPELESGAALQGLSLVFGGMPLQVGWCNGPNSRLNALEYHKTPEVDIAVTDLVLLLARKADLERDLSCDSRRVQAFFLPAGAAIELWPEVLHFSPCRVHASGFKSVIVLPRGTNEALSREEAEAARATAPAGGKALDPEARLLFMRNKWLLAHPERAILVERGAWPGIRGENIEIMTID